MPPSEVTIYTDGASRGNPGKAAISFHIDGDGFAPVEFSEAIGVRTNNFAEYTAMIRALEFARQVGARRVRLHSDSELMVKQMQGEYRVKHADIVPLYNAARELVAGFDRVEFIHVMRGQNAQADRLCNEALDGRPSPLTAADELIAAAAVKDAAGSCRGAQDEIIEFFERLRNQWSANDGIAPQDAWRELQALLMRRKLLKALPKPRVAD